MPKVRELAGRHHRKYVAIGEDSWHLTLYRRFGKLARQEVGATWPACEKWIPFEEVGDEQELTAAEIAERYGIEATPVLR